MIPVTWEDIAARGRTLEAWLREGEAVYVRIQTEDGRRIAGWLAAIFSCDRMRFSEPLLSVRLRDGPEPPPPFGDPGWHVHLHEVVGIERLKGDAEWRRSRS